MNRLCILYLILTALFHSSFGNSIIPTLPPLNVRKLEPRVVTGATVGAASGQAPPPAPPSDDEDAPAAGRLGGVDGSVSGDRPPPNLANPGPRTAGVGDSISSGDFRPPPPPQPPWSERRNGTWVRPTVGIIELPLARTTTKQQPPQVPWMPTKPADHDNSRSCSSMLNQVVQTSQGLRYRPNCQSPQSALYRGQQCGSGACFCVNERTGDLIEATAVPANRPLSCDQLVFAVSLGFEANWDESMLTQSSASFRDYAQRIEGELDRLFSQFQGRQTARLLRLRSGSVIADVRLTSIGHPLSLRKDVQELKQLLDNRVASRQFAGMEVAPRHYSFRREGTTKPNPGDATDSNSPNGAHGSNARAGDINSNDNKIDNQLRLNKQQTDDQQQQQPQQLSAASLFSSPGILAAAIAGGVGCLLIAALIVMFFVYRARKARGGSYKTSGGPAAPGPVNGSNGAAGGKVIYTKASTHEEYFA